MGCSRPGAPGTLMSAMTETSMLLSWTPVAVAPLAFPGPQTFPSVPKLAPALAAEPLLVEEPPEPEPDDPQAARARTHSAASAVCMRRCLTPILPPGWVRMVIVSLTSAPGPFNE